jgi:hypothetical protein
MSKVKGILKVGDIVKWRGSEIEVIDIDVNCNGEKYGVSVDSVEWDEVTGENVVVSLASGHWAYGNQISELI